MNDNKIYPKWLTDGSFSPLEEMKRLAAHGGKDDGIRFKAIEFLCYYMCGKPQHNYDTASATPQETIKFETVQDKSERVMKLIAELGATIGVNAND
jgi:hypothetical protein